ncbi:MAG: hypothetical protein ABI718_00820, partial [Acidobacteriota bacterium]
MRRHQDLSLTYLEVTRPEAAPEVSMPLILALHGRGSDARDLAGLAKEIDPAGEFRFVVPDAPRAFEAYPGMRFGYSWFDGWPPERDSLRASRTLLLKFVSEIRSRYAVPENKLILAGFSQGGLMSLDAGFRLDPPAAGIVVMSGGLNEAELPDFQGRESQRVLIVHGSSDDMIPVLYARKTRRILESSGIEPEYHEFSMGH